MENKLNAYLSDLVVFYHKLQSYHWYIAGHTFLETHGKLEEYYNMINAQIDDVAEVMLMNGYHPVATLEEFKNNSSIKEAKGEFNTDVKAVSQATGLSEESATLLVMLKKLFPEELAALDDHTATAMGLAHLPLDTYARIASSTTCAN